MPPSNSLLREIGAQLKGAWLGLIDSSGKEVSAGGYGRQPAKLGIDISDGGLTASNATELIFPVASRAWGNITHVGLYDAISGGGLLWQLELDVSIPVDVRTQARFPARAITLTLGG